MSQDDADLIARNMALFERMHPALHARLAEVLGRLKDVQTSAPVPSKRFRFQIGPPLRDDVDRQTFDFADALLSRCRSENIPLFEKSRTERTYYLLLIGAPDEAALIEALNRFDPQCLLIGTGDLEAFVHSLGRVDWERHVARILDRGGTVIPLPDAGAEAIVDSAWRTCRLHNPMRIDGFGVLVSGDRAAQQAAAGLLAQTLMLSVTLLGYVHDETLMLWNNYRNFRFDNVRKFRKRESTDTGVPVFVVASGPSLDADLAAIKAHGGSAVVVSLATSLRPLLKAGITPDFHVELENTDITPKFRQLAAEFDLSDISLIASTSVETEALEYFAGAVLYARFALSSYPVFSGGVDETLRLPGPTAGNAALCFALESGFRDVYLFGLDLGTADPARHHSEASYYYTDGADEYPDAYDIPVPGNFRETVYTSRAFLSALKNVDDLAAMFRGQARIHNCADGARIAHAEPLRSAELKITSDASAKDAALTALKAHFTPSDSAAAWPGPELAEAVEAFAARIKAVCADPAALADGRLDGEIIAASNLLSGYQDPPQLGVTSAARMVMRGTLLAMMLFAHRYRTRVAGEGYLDAFDKVFAEELARALDGMAAYAVELLGGDAPKAPPPVAERIAEAGRTLPEPAQIKRNAPCPCGSGRKFKQCHGAIA